MSYLERHIGRDHRDHRDHQDPPDHPLASESLYRPESDFDVADRVGMISVLLLVVVAALFVPWLARKLAP